MLNQSQVKSHKFLNHSLTPKLAITFIVARVQPKMSKGITDLLLLDASSFFVQDIPVVHPRQVVIDSAEMD